MVYGRKIKDPIAFKVAKACISGAETLKGGQYVPMAHSAMGRGADVMQV